MSLLALVGLSSAIFTVGSLLSAYLLGEGKLGLSTASGFVFGAFSILTIIANAPTFATGLSAFILLVVAANIINYITNAILKPYDKLVAI